MKITGQLKANLMSLAISALFGQMNDLEALSATLHALASEVDSQIAAQVPKV